MIVSFIVGWENNGFVVRVFLRYFDKSVVNVFKDNLRIKFVIIVEKIVELLDEMNMIR